MESVTGQSLRETIESNEKVCMECGNFCGLYVIKLAGGYNCNRCFKENSRGMSFDDYQNSPYKAKK